jgi:PTH2 family peptidyl-tRNA hydrolase
MARAEDEEIKQVIIVRIDLDMGKGKLGTQIAHASVLSFLKAEKTDKSIAAAWLSSGQKKIVLKVEDEDALQKLCAAFDYKRIPCALVNDAGLTQLPPGTTTALGVGPWKSGDIDQFTGRLKLL